MDSARSRYTQLMEQEHAKARGEGRHDEGGAVTGELRRCLYSVNTLGQRPDPKRDPKTRLDRSKQSYRVRIDAIFSVRWSQETYDVNVDYGPDAHTVCNCRADTPCHTILG